MEKLKLMQTDKQSKVVTNQKLDVRKRRDNGKHKDVIMPICGSASDLPNGYDQFLTTIKDNISRERLKAQVSANSILVLMYWHIGTAILEKQKEQSWGSRVIDHLSADLKESFPGMKGFSARNLKYMRKFAETWLDGSIVQAVLAQISWYHNIALLEKIKNKEQRLFYAKSAFENGWSRNVLVVQIETKLYARMGKGTNNFEATLPESGSDMANQIFKDPYIFDFLGNVEVKKEIELEHKLVDHIEKFLLELGQGFAFVGRQVHIEVGGDDFYIDLLFYHLHLRCYVIIELKAGKFKAGHISQLNMYMNIVDDSLRHEDDKPTIGLLLVREKNHTVAKYALAGYTKPIGVAEWEQMITESLPKDLQPNLPSIEDLEKELEGGNDED